MSKTKQLPDVVAQVAAGVTAVRTWGENAPYNTLNDPVLTSMAMALLDAIGRAKPGQDDETLATSVAMSMAAAFEYGRNIGQRRQEETENGRA